MRRRLRAQNLSHRRLAGLGIGVIGLIMLFTPLVVGEWVMALLGMLMVAAGMFRFIESLLLPGRRATYLEYIAGAIAVLFGGLLFFTPATVLSGTIAAASLFFVADGAVKLWGVAGSTGATRWWSLANGLFSFALAAALWLLIPADLGLVAIGIVVGLNLLFEGWTMFFAPEMDGGDDVPSREPDEHPDAGLGLPPDPAFREINERLLRADAALTWENIYWSLTVLGILFVVHIVRTDAGWTLLELVSPFTAVAGDAAVALLIAIMIVLPWRLLWRRLTRPVERAAWYRFLDPGVKDTGLSAFERLLEFWMISRMRFSHELSAMRYSMNYTFWRLLRFGLPATAVLVAVNSIWGFSWYFNSENWASAVYQELTKGRVDVWRKRMAEDAERSAVAAGVPQEKVFAIEPEGMSASEDFSFIVIGDTGEGDPSQAVLRDRLIEAGGRPEVKFLVLSSDVVYPDGKMRDYERNFYLPFKGFQKPVYAIPGNHDWFDANEGFNANFLEPGSAQLALRGRLAEDLGTDVITADSRFDELLNSASRLRDYYGVRNGLQRGPYFEMHTPGFSLIALDTGILRRLDERQRAWFEAALVRADGNYKMVVLGHPFYVAGKRTFESDKDFTEIYDIMRRYGVNAAMAGDTHDFEFYRLEHEGGAEMLHFVNGGGGAYLSIGTAVGFPNDPVTPDFAYYPRGDEVNAKIQNEAPLWKLPFLVWLQRLGGWPFDQEMVSGAFDFNSAPFFQSFVEVRVERSTGNIRYLLHGARGPLRWRDVQTGGNVIPTGKTPDDLVEFTAPLGTASGE